MIAVDIKDLLPAANKMADMLDDLVNTLANYSLLQGRSDDPVGKRVTKVQISEIRALLKEVNYDYSN